MAIINVKAEYDGEDVRKLCQEAMVLASGDRGQLSDGFHTFNELYQHRIRIFIALVALLVAQGKSAYRFHHYAGWFCLGVETDFGQISYHIPESQWESCSFAEERQPEFDGHTADDVLFRLENLAMLACVVQG